jgi:hypothetical protein
VEELSRRVARPARTRALTVACRAALRTHGKYPPGDVAFGSFSTGPVESAATALDVPVNAIKNQARVKLVWRTNQQLLKV